MITMTFAPKPALGQRILAVAMAASLFALAANHNASGQTTLNPEA